jgi:hypothetical protein
MNFFHQHVPVPGESQPAYPVWLGTAEDSSPGSDRLDYFAARAPAEPLWNFPVVGLPPRPKVLIPANKSEDGEAVVEGSMPLHEWEERRAVYRRSQWPWVWARAVLRAERIIDEADAFDSQAQCAQAWDQVVQTLNSIAPNWHRKGKTGAESAVAAIIELHEEAKRQREITARERGLSAEEESRLKAEIARLKAGYAEG